jgi:hypothetical protein
MARVMLMGICWSIVLLAVLIGALALLLSR